MTQRSVVTLCRALWTTCGKTRRALRWSDADRAVRSIPSLATLKDGAFILDSPPYPVRRTSHARPSARQGERRPPLPSRLGMRRVRVPAREGGTYYGYLLDRSLNRLAP